MRARVARPRGHRPGRRGACLARAHAVAPAGAGGVQPALVVDARRRGHLQRRRSPALGAVRREPDPAADRGAARGARARRGRRRPRPARARRSRRASAPTWRAPPRPTGPATAERPVSFFCAEYGIHASLPIYSGGLGALAGDILKEASDRALPLVAVGLLYRQGYFRQRIDASGWQHESWVPTDPERQPMALVTGDDGQPITVTVPVGAEQVVAQVWRVDVGRVPLFLLDADRPENGAVARWISSRLYTGTRDLRLAQYLLLGVGGMRALQAMGIDPSVVHLNEGHAAFASLELARAELAARRLARRRAGRGPRAHGLHHAHAGAGRQRHLRARARARVAGHAGRRGRRRPRHDRPPGPHPPRRRRRAVRRHPVRPAHEPLGQRREPPPRRGRARDVGRAVARPRRRRRADRLRHQRRAPADVGRRSDARAARPPPRRGLDGPRRGPRRLGRARQRRRRRAVGRAPRAARRARDLGARAQHGRPPRSRRAARVRRGARTSTPTCSRSASRGAWPPTSACTCCCRAPRGSSTCCRASARSRSSWPARRTRATTTASAACRRCSRPRASPRSAAASPTSTTTT